MNFGEALIALKRGERIAREGWHGKGMSVALQTTTGNGEMTIPYLYITTPTGARVPWVTSQMDVLAEDWTLVDG